MPRELKSRKSIKPIRYQKSTHLLRERAIKKINGILDVLHNPIEDCLIQFTKSKIDTTYMQSYTEKGLSITDKNLAKHLGEPQHASFNLFLADLEQYIDYLIKYNTLKQNKDNILTNTLILDQMEKKNFERSDIVSPNIDMIMGLHESAEGNAYQRLHNENKIKQMALSLLTKNREISQMDQDKKNDFSIQSTNIGVSPR